MNFTEASIEGATAGLRRLQAAYDALRSAPASTGALAAPAEAFVGVAAGARTAAHANAHDRHDAPGHVPHAPAALAVVDAYARRFEAALDDDMNTSGALSVLFEIAGDASERVRDGSASAVAAFVHEAMTVLGISPNDRAKAVEASTTERTVALDGKSATIVGRGGERFAEASLATLRAALGDLAAIGDATGGAAIDAVVEARLRAKARKDFAAADRLRVALAGAGVTLADSKEGTSWSVDA